MSSVAERNEACKLASGKGFEKSFSGHVISGPKVNS